MIVMKYDNLRAFQKHIEGAAPNHLVPVYLILSKEASLCKMATELLLQAIFGKTTSLTSHLNIRRFDGEKVEGKVLLDELAGGGLLFGKQVVVLNRADHLLKATQKQLEEYFKRSNSSVIFIITAESFAANTNFYKNAEKAGVIVSLEDSKGATRLQALSESVNAAVAAENKTIDAQACRLLVNQVGADRELLQNELKKLICYVGERSRITSEDVSKICSFVNQETVWQLGEAVFQRNAANALRITKALMEEGVSFFALLRQLRTQLQTDFHVCSILANGGTHDEIGRTFPYMKGFILDRHIQSATEYGWDRFKKGLHEIDKIELLAKNSSIDEEILAEKIIITLIN